MNTNKNFFDELDRDWEKVLADTYESNAEKILLKTKDIQITPDFSTKEVGKTFNNTLYKVMYTDLINPNYKIDISVSVSKYTQPHILTLEISVLNMSINKYALILEIMGGNIYRQHFKLAKEDPNKPLSELKIEEKPFLNWDMTFNMIEEGIEVINGFDNNNITQKSIDTLKEFIKSKTLNIK